METAGAHVFPDLLTSLTERFRESWALVFPDSPPPAEPRVTSGSWVGGDRDGHPSVTPAVTRRTLGAMREAALQTLREGRRAVERNPGEP